MIIRPVSAADVEALIELWRVIFPEYQDPERPQRDPRANIMRKLAFGDGLFWLAEDRQNICGSVMAGYDGHRGWIYSLGVHPMHRRRGLGSSLMQHTEIALRALGCPKINLQMLNSNALAQDFYIAAGYSADPVMSVGKRLA